MKFAAIGLVLGASVASQAQLSGFHDMFRLLKKEGKLTYTQDVSGEVRVPAKPMALPKQPDDEQVLEVVHYGSISVQGDNVELTEARGLEPQW